MELKAVIARRPEGRTGLTEWYRELFEAADREGLSNAEIAARVGRILTSIYSWRRRFRENALDTGEQSNGLVHVQVADSSGCLASEAPSSRFEVRLRTDRTLVVPTHFDATQLVSLVEVLEQC